MKTKKLAGCVLVSAWALALGGLVAYVLAKVTGDVVPGFALVENLMHLWMIP